MVHPLPYTKLSVPPGPPLPPPACEGVLVDGLSALTDLHPQHPTALHLLQVLRICQEENTTIAAEAEGISGLAAAQRGRRDSEAVPLCMETTFVRVRKCNRPGAERVSRLRQLVTQQEA